MDKTSTNDDNIDNDNQYHNIFKHCYICNIILTIIIVVVIVSSSSSKLQSVLLLPQLSSLI